MRIVDWVREFLARKDAPSVAPEPPNVLSAAGPVAAAGVELEAAAPLNIAAAQPPEEPVPPSPEPEQFSPPTTVPREPDTGIPTCLLCGLSKKHLAETGTIMGAAFEPDDRTRDRRTNLGYQPPGSEKSINWEDDQNAIGRTLSGREAAARVKTESLAAVNALTLGEAPLAWERRLENDNQYHGNIVFLVHVDKPKQRQVAAAIALSAELINA